MWLFKYPTVADHAIPRASAARWSLPSSWSLPALPVIATTLRARLAPNRTPQRLQRHGRVVDLDHGRPQGHALLLPSCVPPEPPSCVVRGLQGPPATGAARRWPALRPRRRLAAPANSAPSNRSPRTARKQLARFSVGVCRMDTPSNRTTGLARHDKVPRLVRRTPPDARRQPDFDSVPCAPPQPSASRATRRRRRESGEAMAILADHLGFLVSLPATSYEIAGLASSDRFRDARACAEILSRSSAAAARLHGACPA